MFDQPEQLKMAEVHLRALNYSTSRISGMVFFRKLVQDLAESLKVKYVMLGELSRIEGAEAIRTLAVWNGTEWPPNFSYLLENTPCQNVIDQKPCFHPRDVQREYPLDEILVEMDAESYIGTPLIDTSGDSLGCLAALDIAPMDEHQHYLSLSLLTIFASRCAAELQHRNHEAELERRVSVRTVELKNANADLRKNEEKLKYVAYHDNLTGLANRALFNEHMERALQLSQRSDATVTVMMLDLDEFKLVNDKYGHAVGDVVLTTVAQRLQNLLRSGDLVARLGGDEFAILLGGVTTSQVSVSIAQSIINAISSPISAAADTQLEIGCTIGIARDRDGRLDTQSLLKLADTAMYKAKRAGKGAWYLAEGDIELNMDIPVSALNSLPGDDNIIMLDAVPTAYPQFDDDEQQKIVSAGLLNLNSSTANVLGEEFFQTLVRNLAEVLDVCYVIAGKLVTLDGEDSIQTIAVWAGGQWLPNISYGLENTPCQDVTCQTMCFHPSGIQQLYPLDKLLVDMGVESYIGIPMIDTQGQTVGTLVAMDKLPINSAKHYVALLLMTMFATRGAAELQHANRQNQMEAALLAKTQELLIAQEQLEKLSQKV